MKAAFAQNRGFTISESINILFGEISFLSLGGQLTAQLKMKIDEWKPTFFE